MIPPRRPEPTDLVAVARCDMPACDGAGLAGDLYCHGCQRYICERHRAQFGAHRVEHHLEVADCDDDDE